MNIIPSEELLTAKENQPEMHTDLKMPLNQAAILRGNSFFTTLDMHLWSHFLNKIISVCEQEQRAQIICFEKHLFRTSQD